MERIPETPPPIAPVPTGVQRPLVSVMIPVYNCSEYVAETIESVLQQGWDEASMQIEVVDDGSTDADVEALVKKVGQGRVGYYRQPQNVGSLRNFETCLNRAKGHYIHILHGDDKVKESFYKIMLGLFDRFPEAGAAFCAFDMIGPDSEFFGTSEKMDMGVGIIENGVVELARKPRLQYACMVVRRSVYEHLGAFCLATYGEDWEMWVRIAKHYPVVYNPDALAIYRVHPSSITRRSYMTGDNLRDLAKIINRIADHLPAERREAITAEARKYWAYNAFNICYSLWYRTHNKKVVHMQMAEALKLHSDTFLILKSGFMNALMLMPKSILPTLRRVTKQLRA